MAAYNSRRSAVYGTKGIVSSSQTLASAAGIEILNKGGNAADAAVACAAVLNVTEPSSTGIGGDMFTLFYEAKSKTVKGLNGSGRAPKALTLDYLRKNGVKGRHIPSSNLNSVTVPGAAAGMVDTVKLYGSGKLSLEEIFAPAIRIAEEGFGVTEIAALLWKGSEKQLQQVSPAGKELLLDGKAPAQGQLFTCPTLAQTYRTIAKQGKDGFYKGRIAQAIVDLISSQGGVMTLEDLAEHTSTEVEPISLNYHDQVILYECPPNGQGLTALVALGILRELEDSGKIPKLVDMDHNSADYLHYTIEAMRLAFADTRFYVTDPECKQPTEELLSKSYLQSRAKLINPKKVEPVKHGSPVNGSDTVYLSVTDKEGNACSFIISVFGGFGTCAVPEGTGFTLHNRGSNFWLDENHPNNIQGGKRPYHTIIPGMALYPNGELMMSFGVMGAFNQPQGQLQVLLNMLRGMDPQKAIDAPRFCIDAETFGTKSNQMKHSNGETQDSEISSDVHIEEGVDDSVLEELQRRGHRVTRASGYQRQICGRGQIIQRIPNKEGKLLFAAGCDPRCDGAAIAQL